MTNWTNWSDQVIKTERDQPNQNGKNYSTQTKTNQLIQADQPQVEQTNQLNHTRSDQMIQTGIDQQTQTRTD